MDISPAPQAFRFKIEAFGEEELAELFDMLVWIREHAITNGRVHFNFEGGVFNSSAWIRGEIVFTNDDNGRDAAEFAAHFKLRWCGDNSQ